MADIAAVAFPLITLLHSHRHGDFHAVCRVPEQITDTKLGKRYYHVPQLTFTVLNFAVCGVSGKRRAEKVKQSQRKSQVRLVHVNDSTLQK